MRAVLDFAITLTGAWVAVYTRGLPQQVRAERREEIDCDLWEHRWLAQRRGDPALGTAIDILTRVLFGIISDITWRAWAGATPRADGSTRMNEAFYLRAGVGIAVALSLSLFFAVGTGAWYWMLAIPVPIGIAMAAIAFYRARRTGAAAGNGVDRMRTNGENRRKWLLLVIGVCVATIVGMGAYAFSLEEWGEVRTMIFNLGGLLAMAIGFTALVMLVSDLVGKRPARDG